MEGKDIGKIPVRIAGKVVKKFLIKLFATIKYYITIRRERYFILE